MLNSATYDPTDVDGCQGSGSILLPPSLGPSFSTCVSGGLNSGFPYTFGYQFKGEGMGFCDVAFYTGAGCVNYVNSDTLGANGNGLTGTWVAVSLTISSPANAGSVMVHCSTAAGDGYYDRFYVSTSGAF